MLYFVVAPKPGRLPNVHKGSASHRHEKVVLDLDQSLEKRSQCSSKVMLAGEQKKISEDLLFRSATWRRRRDIIRAEGLMSQLGA